MKYLEELLREELEDGGHLMGCVRRNLWTATTPTPWRLIRGNAVLAAAGERHDFQTPAGPHSCFLRHGRWLLQFRGGQWNDYWYDEIWNTWSVLHTWGGLPEFSLSTTIFLLQENQGEIITLHIPFPENEDPSARAERLLAMAESDPPGRIAKNTARAYRVCHGCPVRTLCDATDVNHGDTGDWGSGWNR